jgi:hypothetical protein
LCRGCSAAMPCSPRVVAMPNRGAAWVILHTPPQQRHAGLRPAAEEPAQHGRHKCGAHLALYGSSVRCRGPGTVGVDCGRPAPERRRCHGGQKGARRPADSDGPSGKTGAAATRTLAQFIDLVSKLCICNRLKGRAPGGQTPATTVGRMAWPRADAQQGAVGCPRHCIQIPIQPWSALSERVRRRCVFPTGPPYTAGNHGFGRCLGRAVTTGGRPAALYSALSLY